MPAEIWVGINLESELEYGNHRIAAKYGRQVLGKAAKGVTIGRTIFF